MVDMAVSLARDKLLPLILEVANVIRGVPKEDTEIEELLERIQAVCDDTDRMVAAEQDDTSRGFRRRLRQLREAAFRMEDVIEDYKISEEQQPRDPGCEAFLCDKAAIIKTLILRLQIAYEIQDIKSSVREIDETFDSKILTSFEQGSTSCTGSQNVPPHSLREDALYVEEADVVGFEAARAELIGWLEEGRAERTVISVVGMGGLGKTTLAKTVFDKVKGNFDCNACITVTQSYSVDGLLREMLNFWKEKREATCEMDRRSLIEEVRNYLKEKRYVVLFDDVWNKNFWGEMKNALLDNKIRSRIIITTRSMEVAQFCKKDSFVYIQNLQPLTPEESWELFCKKAFQNEHDGCCPEELKDIFLMIVEKCEGLPLAIIAIGGLFAIGGQEKTPSEWQNLGQTLLSELEKDPDSIGITNILGLSYDVLPYHLKLCFLYFGIYPEDYEVESVSLIKQWIAEGFVKYEEHKTLEEVAEQYLKQLIHRSLIQVSSFSSDGKAKRCRIHDMFHEIILKKIEDLSFCHFGSEGHKSVDGGMIRRLKVATNSNNLITIEGSHIRSMHIFTYEKLSEDFVKMIPTKYKRLKVLDFEYSRLNYVPENFGNLIHLRYLSFRNTKVENLPTSIGNLQNLETLDLRETLVHEMPREINKLRKLRHLLAYHTSWHYGGIKMMDGIGGLVSLLTLRQVQMEFREEELIKELARLTQLRTLSLNYVNREYGNTLCSSINEMQCLEKLYINAVLEVIDLLHISSLPALQKLCLRGKLERLPKWIPNLQNLVKLSLICSQLTDDPLKSLKSIPNLLFLDLTFGYEGESLHFQDQGFQKLKKLSLSHLYNLNSVIVSEGALPSLKEFTLMYIPQLNEVPDGIHHLCKLEAFHIMRMPEKFTKRLRENDWIKKHVDQVNVDAMSLRTQMKQLWFMVELITYRRRREFAGNVYFLQFKMQALSISENNSYTLSSGMSYFFMLAALFCYDKL